MLIGADGQLGTDLVQVLSGVALVPLTHRDIEVCDTESVRRVFDAHQPEIVINTAAFHKVDEAESKPERAFAVNAMGPGNLALACRESDATLVHLSTDYVFDGRKRAPYKEGDTPCPVNVYGTSKLAGEHLVCSLLPQHYIVRTTGLFGIAGMRPGRGNFVETMLRLARDGREIRVVNDQTVSPTYTFDLAQAIGDLIKTKQYGVYHITNSDSCTWFEFATEIFRCAGVQPDFSDTSTAAFGSPSRRPPYSVLDNSALDRVGVPRPRSWQAALKAYFERRNQR